MIDNGTYDKEINNMIEHLKEKDDKLLALAIESSGNVASVALVQEDKVICEYTLNDKKTHSQTLMPMIEEIFNRANIKLEQIDLVAVSKGPGSFTGLRIGAATAKGFAHGLNLPIVGVSSLEILAYNILDTGKLICPVIDAKRNQVYTTLYKNENSELIRLCDEKALHIEEIISIATTYDEEIIFIGDGFYPNEPKIKELLNDSYSIASINNNIPRASTIGMLGIKYSREGKVKHYIEYTPEYLRKSQAEREYEARKKDVNN